MTTELLGRKKIVEYRRKIKSKATKKRGEGGRGLSHHVHFSGNLEKNPVMKKKKDKSVEGTMGETFAIGIRVGGGKGRRKRAGL